MTLLILAFLGFGLLLQGVATVGIMRLPDPYTRIHMVGMADTMGIVLILVAVAIAEGMTSTTLKLVMVILFYFLANPTAAHAIGRAALRSGLSPWTRKEDAP